MGLLVGPLLKSVSGFVGGACFGLAPSAACVIDVTNFYICHLYMPSNLYTDYANYMESFDLNFHFDLIFAICLRDKI